MSRAAQRRSRQKVAEVKARAEANGRSAYLREAHKPIGEQLAKEKAAIARVKARAEASSRYDREFDGRPNPWVPAASDLVAQGDAYDCERCELDGVGPHPASEPPCTPLTDLERAYLGAMRERQGQ